MLFDAASLDDREKVIYADADSWWATRFQGRGVYDKIGPFATATEAVGAVMQFFRAEERDYPPPGGLASKPFSIYAGSSKHGDSHVIVGNVYRDGEHRPTHREVAQRVREAKALVATTRKSRRRANPARPT